MQVTFSLAPAMGLRPVRGSIGCASVAAQVAAPSSGPHVHHPSEAAAHLLDSGAAAGLGQAGGQASNHRLDLRGGTSWWKGEERRGEVGVCALQVGSTDRLQQPGPAILILAACKEEYGSGAGCVAPAAARGSAFTLASSGAAVEVRG